MRDIKGHLRDSYLAELDESVRIMACKVDVEFGVVGPSYMPPSKTVYDPSEFGFWTYFVPVKMPDWELEIEVERLAIRTSEPSKVRNGFHIGPNIDDGVVNIDQLRVGFVFSSSHFSGMVVGAGGWVETLLKQDMALAGLLPEVKEYIRQLPELSFFKEGLL